jgi:serine/threonine protein kinase
VQAEDETTDLPVFGRYQTYRMLGEGAMASVYLAKDPHLTRRVAIKVVKSHLLASETALMRFRNEASILANLRHPNILQVFDYDVEDDQHYLVMEYIEGPGFQSLLNDLAGRPMRPQIAAYFLYQAAQGLAVAHKQGLVHRDIKPDNMLLSADGTLRIADFGIAHVADLELTQAGDIMGTPFYMAPEQTLAETPIPQTDLWALGVVLYYCLTGRRPFEGADFSAIKLRIRQAAYRPITDFAPAADPELVSLVAMLLAYEPQQRGTAQALVLRLKRYLDKTGIEDWEAQIRGFLAQVGQTSLEKTTLEFHSAMAKPPLGSSTGKRKATTHRIRREAAGKAEDDGEEAENAAANPEPAPAARTPGMWTQYKHTLPAWIFSILFMVGMQYYVRWNMAHPPVPVAPQERANVEFRSIPSGAEISVDGDALGITPISQTYKPGSYVVHLTHPAFPGQIKDTTVLLRSGPSHLTFRFSK